MQNILVVGGAGYIGSHTARLLSRQGRRVVVYDNLSRGHRQAVKDLPLVVGELSDTQKLLQTLVAHEIQAVVHFAAHSQVGESQQQPLLYYENNVAGTLSLLDAMKQASVRQLVFSSTAAVYGEAPCPIGEDALKQPTNVYGRTKWMMEQVFADCAQAEGLRYVALRYFNAAGAHPDADIGEDHAVETHLIPIVLQVAAGRRDKLTVFGEDYATPDGTCVRDYIHVCDLAKAHALALDHLQSGGDSRVYNLGNGNGFSVMDIIRTASGVTGIDIPYIVGKRRDGDPARLVADSGRIQRELGYTSDFASLEDIVRTAWNWHRLHPDGYVD